MLLEGTCIDDLRLLEFVKAGVDVMSGVVSDLYHRLVCKLV